MKRVACVYIPHFVAEVERQRHETEMRPLLIAEGERVLGACARAAGMGVVEGEAVSEAVAHCPDACVIPADPPRYAAAWDALVEMLGRHSPGVEPERWGLAYLDATGLGRVYGDEETWCALVRQQAWGGVSRCSGIAEQFTAWWPPVPASSPRLPDRPPEATAPRLLPRGLAERELCLLGLLATPSASSRPSRRPRPSNWVGGTPAHRLARGATSGRSRPAAVLGPVGSSPGRLSRLPPPWLRRAPLCATWCGTRRPPGGARGALCRWRGGCRISLGGGPPGPPSARRRAP